MLTSDLVKRFKRITKSVGDLPVLLQSDGEGNSYDYARGAQLIFVTKDLQHTYDTFSEAMDSGADPEDLETVIVVFP